MIEHTFYQNLLTFAWLYVYSADIFFRKNIFPVKIEIEISGYGSAASLNAVSYYAEEISMEQTFASFLYAISERIVDDTQIRITLNLGERLAHRLCHVLVLTFYHDKRNAVYETYDVWNDERLGIIGIDSELVYSYERITLMTAEVDDFSRRIILACLFIFGEKRDAFKQEIMDFTVSIYKRFINFRYFVVAIFLS